MSPQERRIMEHALGRWRRGKGDYRNHFCAGPDHDDWAALNGLVARGLMRVRVPPDPLFGGMTTFGVTLAGKMALAQDKDDPCPSGEGGQP